VQQRGGGVRLDIGSLDWLQAEGEYVRLHVGEKSYLTRSPISTLAAELAGFGFVRIHRSVVVNQERLRAVRRMRSGGMTAVLANSVELPVGRKFRQSVSALTRPGMDRS
jgi:DNA-binding LytR/AlgR family response regulator